MLKYWVKSWDFQKNIFQNDIHRSVSLIVNIKLYSNNSKFIIQTKRIIKILTDKTRIIARIFPQMRAISELSKSLHDQDRSRKPDSSRRWLLSQDSGHRLMKFSIIRKSIYYRKQALDYLLMKRKWDSDVQLHFGFRVNMKWKSSWWQLHNLLVAKLSQLEDCILDIMDLQSLIHILSWIFP